MPEVVEFVVAGQPREAASSAAGFTGRPWTVVYDGHCRVCTRLANALKRLDRDRRMDVLPSQTAGLAARFPWIPARAYRESMQLVGPGGETLQGAAAIERILDLLPRGRWVSWVFSIPLARPLAERLYRWFARNRYRLGCGAHCQYRPTDVDFGAS
jgi:predicted DCC family thiol-disulfide oxidoreductase YuxK